MQLIGGITGRDPLIKARALYDYIKLQQSLPITEREWSNEQDAKRILVNEYPIFKTFIEDDLRKGRKPAVLIDEKALPESADQ